MLIVQQSVLDDTGFMQGVLACARSLHYGTPYALQNALGVVLDSNHALEAIQGAFAPKATARWAVYGSWYYLC